MTPNDQRTDCHPPGSWFTNLLAAPGLERSAWLGMLWPVGIFLLVVQVLTGILLMTVYSPSLSSAWASVWYLQTKVPAGWLIRGLHHFASDALLIVLAIHALTIVVTKAYRAPTRFAWWITIGVLGLAMGLSLTGHLLPWDQAGYWGTTVRTNILAKTPMVGAALRRILIGGTEMGALTITHFYTLHVMVLPLLLGGLIAGYMGRVRALAARNGAGAKDGTSDAVWLRRSLAFLIVLAGLVLLAWYRHTILGDELLDAPADAGATDYPARPEWHTLFLFQWLKYFAGSVDLEVVGAVMVPNIIIVIFVALPFLQRFFRPHTAHRIALTFTLVIGLGAAWLSYAGVRADRDPPDSRIETARSKQQSGESLAEIDAAVLRARNFNRNRARARVLAARAFVLAEEHGIPPAGPLELLANDPIARGPALFAQNCASCHRFDGHNGLGYIPDEPPTSSDLAGFATRRWIRGLLADPSDDRYFGRMTKPDGDPAHTRMARFVAEMSEDVEDDQQRERLSHDYDAVAAYLEFESLHPGELARSGDPREGGVVDVLRSLTDELDATLIGHGRGVFLDVCNECHSYDGERSGTFRAPEMLGYGSANWIERMVTDPAHDSLYRSRGREPAQMPAFEDRLSQRDRNLVARWLAESRELHSVR